MMMLGEPSDGVDALRVASWFAARWIAAHYGEERLQFEKLNSKASACLKTVLLLRVFGWWTI